MIIEVDGNSHEGKEEYDAKRDKYLDSLGLMVIHIAAEDVKHNLDGVMRMLRNHPALRTSDHPGRLRLPPLQRRGISYCSSSGEKSMEMEFGR